MEQQRAAYAVDGVDESEPAHVGQKRKKQVYTNGEDVRTKVSPNPPSVGKYPFYRELTSDLVYRRPAAEPMSKKENPPQKPGNGKILPSMLPLYHSIPLFKKCTTSSHAAVSLLKKSTVVNLASSCTPTTMGTSKETPLSSTFELRAWIWRYSYWMIRGSGWVMGKK